jgi:hypothetical protein
MSNPYYVSQVSAAHWHEYSYSVIYIISTRRAFGRCVLRANSTMGTPPIVLRSQDYHTSGYYGLG